MNRFAKDLQPLQASADQSDSDDEVLAKIDHVLQQRQRIAASLSVIANRSDYRTGRQLHRLAGWFAADPTGEQVLQRPAATAIGLAIWNATDDAGQLTDEALQRAIAPEAMRFRPQGLQSQLITAVVIYPAFLALSVLAIMAWLSFTILPAFEQVFDEFYLAPSAATQTSFAAAAVVRRFSPLIIPLLVMLGVLAVAILMVQKQLTGRDADYQIGGSWQRSRRQVWAWWTWHTHSLLKLGFSRCQAMRIANLGIGANWLRRISELWLSQMDEGTRLTANGPRVANQSRHLLVTALQSPDKNVQLDLLDQSARLDWQRDRNLLRWWLMWCSIVPIILVGLGLCIVAVFLLMPLFDLMSGLM